MTLSELMIVSWIIIFTFGLGMIAGFKLDNRRKD